MSNEFNNRKLLNIIHIINKGVIRYHELMKHLSLNLHHRQKVMAQRRGSLISSLLSSCPCVSPGIFSERDCDARDGNLEAIKGIGMYPESSVN